jgi:hypothetical protein
MFGLVKVSVYFTLFVMNTRKHTSEKSNLLSLFINVELNGDASDAHPSSISPFDAVFSISYKFENCHVQHFSQKILQNIFFQ